MNNYDTAIIQVTPAAVARLRQLYNDRFHGDDTHQLLLRIMLEGGGCAGFKYVLSLTTQSEAHDKVMMMDAQVGIAIDELSVALLQGSTLDYRESLTSAAFEITHNPQASKKCGCGTSFAP